VKVDGLPMDDAWRELASRLPPPAPGMGPVPLTDARAAARAVIDRAGSSILLVREGAPTEFGRTFCSELVVTFGGAETPPNPPGLVGGAGGGRPLVLALVEEGATGALG